MLRIGQQGVCLIGGESVRSFTSFSSAVCAILDCRDAKLCSIYRQRWTRFCECFSYLSHVQPKIQNWRKSASYLFIPFKIPSKTSTSSPQWRSQTRKRTCICPRKSFCLLQKLPSETSANRFSFVQNWLIILITLAQRRLQPTPPDTGGGQAHS